MCKIFALRLASKKHLVHEFGNNHSSPTIHEIWCLDAHFCRWSDIDTDLNNELPFFLNIRKLHEGIKQLNTKKTGGNLHCIMAFEKSVFQGLSKKTASKMVLRQENDDSEEEGT